tara:strand:+ start:343 stop:579 length:237 start_codon:yes stop_codon:yes gene_type:complete
VKITAITSTPNTPWGTPRLNPTKRQRIIARISWRVIDVIDVIEVIVLGGDERYNIHFYLQSFFVSFFKLANNKKGYII